MTNTFAIVIHTALGASTFPAKGRVCAYILTAFTTESQTRNTPGTDAPCRSSTLVIVFQVSPTDKCKTKARRAGERRVFVVSYTREEAIVRRTPMEIQMTGKALAGGLLGKKGSEIPWGTERVRDKQESGGRESSCAAN